jgi:hypothetical protein
VKGQDLPKARWCGRLSWSLGVLAFLGALAFGVHWRLQTRAAACMARISSARAEVERWAQPLCDIHFPEACGAFLQARVVACGAHSPFACMEAERLARPLCAERRPGSCEAVDYAYGVEFDQAASLYDSCIAAEPLGCIKMAWRLEQRSLDELDRQRMAATARRLCERRNASACVALGVYLGNGFGVRVDHEGEGRAFETAFELGASYACQWPCHLESGNACYTKGARNLRRRCEEKQLEARARGVPYTDYFYVEGAKLDTLNLARDSDRYAHRDPREPNAILSGAALVLSIRTRDPGDLGFTDASSFEKFSIEIPTFQFGKAVDLNAPGVRSYFAAGASSWSPAMGQVYAVRAHGTVTILSIDSAGEMKARLNISCQPERTPPGSAADGRPEARSFLGEFSFKRMKLDELSPWLGGKGPGLRNF